MITVAIKKRYKFNVVVLLLFMSEDCNPPPDLVYFKSSCTDGYVGITLLLLYPPSFTPDPVSSLTQLLSLSRVDRFSSGR